MLRHLVALLPLLAGALMMAGCAGAGTRPGKDVDFSKLGKVHIRYVYTAEDAAAPPHAFWVMRSASESGPFAPVHDGPIDARRNPAAGDQQLLLTDYGLPLGATYFYYLDRVTPEGKRLKAAPVVGVPVTLPLADGEQRKIPEEALEEARRQAS